MPITHDERTALYAASDLIAAQAAPRNEREAHAALCARCDSDLCYCVTPERCAGSTELPNWLLAVLFGLAMAAVLFVAPGVQ